MRSKPTDIYAKTDAMKHLPVLLLILVASPAFSGELSIDPARLQQQVQQFTGQAAQQGAAPSAAATWLTEPTTPAQGYGQGGMGQGSGARQGQGYGQGYENRYGQNADHTGSSSTTSPAGMRQGAGMSGGGRGRH